jgi:2-aminoadipate transaminase
VIGLGGGLPAPELFPRAVLSRAFLRAIERSDGLQYGWPEGNRGLRAWVAERLRDRGAFVADDEVIVTSGAQQAIAIATQVLRQRGKTIEVDAESYPAAIDLFRARGLRLVEARGPIGDAVTAAYVMPGVTNPRGHGMSDERRRGLLSRGGALIVDEAYAELRFDGKIERPLLADARDRTFHIGTVSKTLAPGLRVGWLVPPRRDLDAALAAKRDLDLQAPSLAQAILEEYLARDDFDARLVRARRFYRRRAERFVRALRRAFPTFRIEDPEGGFCVWVETDEDGDDTALLSIATDHGVSFDPGRLFRHDERSSPIAMRLCYSATAIPELETAVSRLERAFRAFNASRSRRRTARGPAATASGRGRAR